MAIKKSSNIYWLDPQKMRELKVEVNYMNRENCFEHCNTRGHLPLQKRQEMYDRLKKAMEDPAFWRDDNAIEITLNREPYGPDKIKQGHHRLNIAIELKMREVPVRFSYETDDGI